MYIVMNPIDFFCLLQNLFNLQQSLASTILVLKGVINSIIARLVPRIENYRFDSDYK